MLPEAFIWTKMGAESGEGLDGIVRRKEFERRLGGGKFAWGIGNALGSAVRLLASNQSAPCVIFSRMRSKPQRKDASPAAVLLWTAYEDEDGLARALPPHMVVTSRGDPNGGKSRHYTLFCSSVKPLAPWDGEGDEVTPENLRNIVSGGSLGSSQVTAVVKRCLSPEQSDGKRYRIAFRASLVDCMYAKLLAPRVLCNEEVAEMAAAADSGFDAWAEFVDQVRNTLGETALSNQEISFS